MSPKGQHPECNIYIYLGSISIWLTSFPSNKPADMYNNDISEIDDIAQIPGIVPFSIGPSNRPIDNIADLQSIFITYIYQTRDMYVYVFEERLRIYEDTLHQ